MARPRKSRLVPSLITFAEELVRILSSNTERVVRESSARLEREVAGLRREIGRLRAQRLQPRGQSGRPRSTRACSVPGCGLPHVARGLCKNHYQKRRYDERRRARPS